MKVYLKLTSKLDKHFWKFQEADDQASVSE